jgi:predicted phosphodiesterase/uncharacterized protein (DUF2384 family)
VPDGDVLVHCGDLTLRGTESETEQAFLWLARLSHRTKIVVAGNHDFFFDPEAPESFHGWSLRRTGSIGELLGRFPNISYLCDEALEVDGVLFYGSPWQPYFGKWAFNLSREELAGKWKHIPPQVDILITHGPPHGILDINDIEEQCGDKALLDAVLKIAPRTHAFGHIHESYGTERRNKTLFLNASICDGQYIPNRQPIVVDMQRGEEAKLITVPTGIRTHERQKTKSIQTGAVSKPPSVPRDEEVRVDANRIAKVLRLKERAVARLLGVQSATLGHDSVCEQTQQPGRRIVAILDALADMLGDERSTLVWMRKPHPALQGASPIQAIEHGDLDVVEGIVEHLRTGQPS